MASAKRDQLIDTALELFNRDGYRATGKTTLVRLLAETELSLDELVRRSGLTSAEVTAAMTMLAIKGAVSQHPGGVFAARRA